MSRQEIFTQRDPRRVEPIVQWILGLPLEFQGDSAFASTCRVEIFGLRSSEQLIDYCTVSKTLTLFINVVDACSPYFNPVADKYMALFLANTNTGYAEVRHRMSCPLPNAQYERVSRLGTT